ncbi:TAXI family TRAP transporter solute-binding subunit [Paenibacillus faecalis]|uniref:TAXI family TRAP transporter solute-binding subunit n=1 Tax=Paenibacillus faecalis TaxID=2079532 RepID=UPI000D10AC99|nr:TAXI family TRAP transporter solute-binding subunit [Paenibacillus faecalis]
MAKRRSLLFTFVLILGAAVIASGCSGAGNGKSLSVVTGGTGGTYYPLGGGMAKLISDKTEYTATAQISNASAENMNLINTKKADIAFTQTDIASYAVEGQQMFKEPLTSIKGIATLYPETVQIVTLKEKGINTVEDLKGKVVSIGAPGSGTEASASQILEIHGMTTEDIKAQHLSFDESTEGIQDGTIDAAFVTAGTPTGAVDSLQAVKDVSIVGMSEDKIKEMTEKYPFYVEDTIKAGTYGLQEDVKTVAVLAMLVARADLDEETVYEATKAIFDNVGEIGHAKAEFINVESALDGMDIDIHPGADKYFKEKGLK